MKKLHQIILESAILSGLVLPEGIHAKDGLDDVSRMVQESKEIIKSVDKTDLEIFTKELSPKKMDQMLKKGGVQDIIDQSMKDAEKHQSTALESIKACQTKKCKSSMKLGLTAKDQMSNLSNGKIQDKVLVFVSSSMPKESLRELFYEAQKIGARLVFRGLIENSFKETQSYFRNLKINADIDPLVFEEYAITHVPTFLVQDKSSGKKDILKGNISLREALIKFKDRGDFPDISKDFLKILETQV